MRVERKNNIFRKLIDLLKSSAIFSEHFQFPPRKELEPSKMSEDQRIKRLSKLANVIEWKGDIYQRRGNE